MFTAESQTLLRILLVSVCLPGCGGLDLYQTPGGERDSTYRNESYGQLFEVQLPPHDELIEVTASDRFLIASLRSGNIWRYAIYDWEFCEDGYTGTVAEMTTAEPERIDAGSDLVVIGTRVYRLGANGFEEQQLLNLETHLVQHVEVLGHAQVLAIVNNQGHVFQPGFNGWYPTQGLPDMRGTPVASGRILAVGDRIWRHDEDGLWRNAGANVSYAADFVDIQYDSTIDSAGRTMHLDDSGRLQAGADVIGRRWIANGTAGMSMNGLQLFNTDNELVSEHPLTEGLWFAERQGDRLVLRDDNDTVMWMRVDALPSVDPPEVGPAELPELDAAFEVASGNLQTYQVETTVGAARLTVTTTGDGDADLLVNYGAQAQFSSSDCGSFNAGSQEVCTFENPQSGTWHISVVGTGASSAGRVTAFVDYPSY